MKIILTVLTLLIFFASILAGFLSFEKQTGQACGPPEKITENTYLFTEWKTTAEKDAGFIDCIGPSYYLVYRPLDFMALGLVVSSATFITIKKNY